MTAEADNHGAVVIPGKDERGCFTNRYFPNVPDLAFDLETVDGFRGKAAVTVVEQDCSEVGVVPSHLDAVLIEVPDKQDVRQAIIVGIDDDGIAVGGELGLAMAGAGW